MHRLKPGGQNQWDVLSRRRFETDAASWHSCRGLPSGSEFFVFQQDSAPSHRAKDTVALRDQETRDFIPPALWPPNLPNLNPVDYTMWSVQVCRTKISDVDELKRCDASTASGPLWVTRLLNVMLSSHEWRRRLLACVRGVLVADILSTCCNKDEVIWHVRLFEILRQ